MERRKFFTRCSQALAGAVLAHLQFGNLAPIPQQYKVTWGKLFTVANADGSWEMRTAYATEEEVREIERLPEQTILPHKEGEQFISYYQIQEGHYLMGENGVIGRQV